MDYPHSIKAWLVVGWGSNQLQFPPGDRAGVVVLDIFLSLYQTLQPLLQLAPGHTHWLLSVVVVGFRGVVIIQTTLQFRFASGLSHRIHEAPRRTTVGAWCKLNRASFASF